MEFVEKLEEYFITIDGKHIYSLADLLVWLYNTEEKNFQYHKTHLSDWLKFSLKEEELSKKILECNNKEEFIRILEDYIQNKNNEKIDFEENLANIFEKIILK